MMNNWLFQQPYADPYVTSPNCQVSCNTGTCSRTPYILECVCRIQGEVKDPLIEKLLETVNNENDQELELMLKAEAAHVDRIRNTEIRGASLLHYACSR